MKKAVIFWKRKKAQELKNKEDLSVRKIANRISASKTSVSKWLRMTEEEVKTDNRGCLKKRIKYTKQQEERVIQIRKELEKEESYFYGIEVVKKNYKNRYKENISNWFIYDVLKQNGMIHKKIKKKKGRSKYMNYPQRKLSKCGKTVAAMDFVGPKYIKGKSKGVNFLSIKYLRPQTYGIVKRVEGQTTNEVLRVLKKVFKKHPIPDVMKMDNDSAFGAHSTHKKIIGRVTKFLLNLGVRPMYVAPKSPWNNGSVEGYNSVFGKKFWNSVTFGDENEIDIEIKKFNMEYKKYSKLVGNNPKISNKKYLKKKQKCKEKIIYFLRIVRRKGDKGKANEKGFINILGVDIAIDKSHINSFMFCELNLEKGQLSIGRQKKDKINWIKKRKFKVTNVPSS